MLALTEWLHAHTSRLHGLSVGRWLDAHPEVQSVYDPQPDFSRWPSARLNDVAYALRCAVWDRLSPGWKLAGVSA